MASADLLKALAVTAELLGTTHSKEAAAVLAADLAQYPEALVIAALAKCRREVKGRLTLADIVTRIDDGRPGPEEAWAQIPKSEAETVVWCEEAAQAYGVALPLLEEGDHVGARMAFREAYAKRVADARTSGKPVQWLVSLGHDQRGRQEAIAQAVTQGRIAHDYALSFSPVMDAPRLGHDPIGGALRMIAHEALKAGASDARKIRGHLKALREVIRGPGSTGQSAGAQSADSTRGAAQEASC